MHPEHPPPPAEPSGGTVLVVGDGSVAAALVAMTAVLGWEVVVVVDDVEATKDAVGRLGESDAVVVLSHDEEVDGPALAAALDSGAGYVAAMGSRRTQQRRSKWLGDNGVPAERIDKVRGPAGLDIGADTPSEIAVSIVSEIIAVRRGARMAADTEARRESKG